MKKYSIFIWPNKTAFDVFIDVAKVFHETLTGLGFDVIIENDIFHSDRTNIIFGANEIVRQFLNVLANSIIINLEQMNEGSYWVNDTYLNLLRQNVVWDYSSINIEFFKCKGINNVKQFEIGYGKSLEYNIDNINQDIDVLFIGSMNDRRIKIHNDLINHPDLKNKTIIFKFGAFGNERDTLIKRAKIVLNIHFYESKILEVVRISHLLANKKCVISENSIEIDKDLEWGKGLIITNYNDIAEKVVYILNNDKIRHQKERNAYKFIISKSQTLPL